MSYFSYQMTVALEVFEIRSKTSDKVVRYQVLFLPPALEQQLPFAENPRLRAEGEIEDVPVEVALQPSGARGHYVLVSPTVRKTLGLRPGSEVTFRFNLAPPDRVHVPEELQAALAASRRRRDLWNRLTPGRQRGLAHLVASAKTIPTRMKRVALVFDELERGVVEKTGPRPTSRAGAKRPRRRS